MKFNRAGGGTEDVLARDLPGRLVRAVVRLANGYVDVPAGTVLEVSNSTNGRVHVRGPACPACGVAPLMRRIERRCLEILPPGGEGG